MPNAKKSNFVTGKYPRRTKRRSLGDAFYFDPDAWARLEESIFNQKGPTRRGDKRPREEVARLWASRRRNQAARTLAATEHWHEARSRIRRVDLVGVILAAWFDRQACYGERDLVRLSGIKRSPLSAALRRMEGLGLIERRLNPAYVGKLDPIQRAALGAGNVEPKFLWRLSDAGLKRKRAGENKPSG